MHFRATHSKSWTIMYWKVNGVIIRSDKWNILEILLMLLLMWVQNVAYNGLILLVFADIFYGSKELNTKRDRKYWFAFILVSFLMLLVTNSDVFSLFFSFGI